MDTLRRERWGGLAAVPVLLTLFYAFGSPVAPGSLWPSMVPQAAAYACIGLWCAVNDRRLDRLFLVSQKLGENIRIGFIIGILTSLVNLWVILKMTPWLGFSHEFLRHTPHARAPFALMVPWGIVAIASVVEINFRGFLLGRLVALAGNRKFGAIFAVFLSAVVFSWDPFMVAVFRGYHWLALTDGIIWGALLIWTRSLYSTITAHAVEVMIVYGILWLIYA